LDNTITISENAFLGAPSIIAKAASVETAQAVAASGAQDIVLNISYIPKTKSDNLALEVGKIDTFELRGEADTYRGFTLKSDAKNTIINRVNVTAGKGTALNLSSENVTLNGVDMRINATACAMLLKAPHTNVFLKDTIYLSSNNKKPLICKEVTFEPLSSEDIAKITVDGDVLVCDSKEDVIGKENLECDSIVEITADDFAKYELGVIEVSFDANGGNVSQTAKEAYYGDVIGELPTPIRDYYIFDGWYTKADCGEQYVANTILNSTDNIVLYAHWTLVPYKVSWSNGTGYTISVNRTSSPNANASTGALSSGATVYYGDVLSVTYTASTGYSISSKGITSTTVVGNVTSSSI
jgi:uncharacterized repeat protein (TIGR02543 family)